MQSIARYFAPAHLAFVLIFLIGALSLSATTLILVDDRSYEQKIAAAKALATEGSWAKARDAYTEALPLAPDADARRWCELWIEDATWRSEKQPEWPAVQTWIKHQHQTFSTLLQPYVHGLPHDEFWMAAFRSQTDFKQSINDPAHWKDRLDIADYLADQPPSTEAAIQYVDYIRLISDLAAHGQSYGLDTSRLLTHAEKGVRIGATADDRAWCSLFIAKHLSRMGHLPLKVRDRCWQQALTEAHGTRWEALIKIDDLRWRLSRINGEAPPQNTPKDIPAALFELAAMRSEFMAASNPETISAMKWIDLLDKKLGEKQLLLSAPTQLRPGDPLVISFGAANIESLHATLEQQSLKGALLAQIKTDLSSPDDETVIREWGIPLTDIRRGAWNTNSLEVAPNLEPGVYSLRLEGKIGSNTIFQTADIQVSDFVGMSFTTENGVTDAFLRNHATGVPIGDADVSGWIGTDDQPLQQLHTRTDHEGRFHIPALPTPPVDESREEIIAALVNGQPVSFERRVNEPYSHQYRLILDAIFDRPIYKPGETVHWKLIARERRDGRFVTPSDYSGMMLASELNGEALLDLVPIKFNAFGTAQGEFVIPDNAKPGEANFMIGNKKDLYDIPLGGIYEAFRVDNFVPPVVEAKVELISGPDSMRPGHEMVFNVKVAYLSGGAVTGAKVACEITFDRPYESNQPALSASTEAWAESLEKNHLQEKTDPTGAAEFRLQLPTDLPDASSLRISATVIPEGAMAVKIDQIFWFLSTAGAFLDTQEWYNPRPSTPGDDFTFQGRIVDGTNSPARFEGEARLVELHWTEAWLDPHGNMVSGAELAHTPHEENQRGTTSAPSWRKLHAEFAVTQVTAQPVHTDSFGRFTTSFKVPHAGIFQIRIYRNGAIVSGGDRALRVGPTVFAIDASTQSLALPFDEGFVIGPASVKPAQAFEVLVALPEGIRTGWLNVCGEESLSVHRVSPPGRVERMVVDQPPKLSGHAELELLWDKEDHGRYTRPARCRITCNDESLSLGVTVMPKENTVRPGSSAAVVIKVNDSNGKPVNAELGFTAYDEALAKLLGQPGQISPIAFQYGGKVVQVRSRPIGSITQPTGIQAMGDPRIEQISLSAGDSSNEENDTGGVQGNFSITSTDANEEAIALSPFVVEASEDSGYQAKDTLAGTRLRTELKPKPTAAVSGSDPKLSIEIRRHFSSTAFWAPDIVTDEKGEATVSFKYPDNLTQWRLEAYAVGANGNSFGRAATFTRTSLPFQARLQLPRFLIAGDTAEPSALLLNRTDADFSASAELKLKGPVVATDPTQLTRNGLSIPKQGEAHTAWSVQAEAPGSAEFSLTGRTGSEGDAMMLPLPVLEDGIQQHTVASGRLAPDAKKLDLKLELPKPLDLQRTHVTVQLSSSHAAVVLDALPYLVDYPYGCVEQTMSRFLPAVIAQKTLTDLGLNAAAVEQRILSGETTADAKRRTGTAGLTKIDDVVQKSLGRLIEAQSPDRGFGWWPGATSTDLWMTAYVAWGLGIAKSVGVAVPDNLETGTQHALVRFLSDESGITDVHAWTLAALSGTKLEDENSAKIATAAFARVYAARDRLSATGRACLARATVKFGDAAQQSVLLRNLENGAERVHADDLGDTVHWGKTGNYWNAMDGAVETTSLTLLALLELDPKHPLIEPAMNWLVLNRRSSHWQSTRDSAFAVLALTKYIALRHELSGELEAEVFALGKSVGRVKLNRDSVLKGTTTLNVPAALLRPGTNTITLKRVSGTGPFYAVAQSSAWATSDTVKPAGHLVDVARGFIRQKSEPTLIGTLRITPQPLPSGGSAVAGEQVTAKVTITVPNNLEYVMIEVPKPAGCEPLNPLSGWDAKIRRVDQTTPVTKDDEDSGYALYREERDEKSVFFLEKLAAGTWEIRFGMRAVTPGNFRALPVQATAMYVPEITANSDAQRVAIQRAN